MSAAEPASDSAVRPTSAGVDSTSAGGRGLSSATLLLGPPGSGKSHRLAGVLAAAIASGHRVLRAQPAQVETQLVGSALLDLAADVTDGEIDALPAAQAAALSAAVLRREGPSTGLTPQAVMLAFTTLLRGFAASGPVLVAVDDVQWLDEQTAAVLAFAARRLPGAGVTMVLALRTEPGVPEPDFVASLEATLTLTREVVAPLDHADLADLVRLRLGPQVSQALVRTAVEAAGGNPLFAIEVARTLQDRGPMVDGVPLPASLAELVGRHVRELPESSRVGLAAASALRRPTLRHLRQLGLADGLPLAEQAGLIRIDGHDVTFTHPLYAAAAYQSLVGSERMRLHARLATVVVGEEERARHLALGADVADEAVALALDGARDRALRRGAVHAAVDACRLALRATPADSPERAGRLIHFGRLMYRVGESTMAKHELGEAAEIATEPHVRARALCELARVVCDTESEQRAAELGLAALPLAAGDPALEADIHMGLALCRADDWQVAVTHARTACRLLDGDPDTPPQKLAAALTSLAGASFYAGLGADVEACRRAADLETDAVAMPVSDRAIAVLAYLQMWTDDFDGARESLRRAHDLALDEGDEASRAYVLSLSAALALRTGEWDLAARSIDECEQLCLRFQNEYFGRVARQHAAWLAAYRGDLGTARSEVDRDTRPDVVESNPLAELRGRALAGFCALAGGDLVTAAAELSRYTELFDVNNAAEPALRQLAADHIEALAGVGRLVEARAALVAIVEPATRLGRASVLAAAARAEALLLAAEGDVAGSLVAADRAVAAYDRLERPFERARALLVRGQIHRRAKHKALARDDLAAAVAEFDRLGAALFAVRARAELDRIGLRPAASAELTATERQIAELTARGMTSSEVAAQLFVSTKTVSANLTRIYRKLGVRNRSELTAFVSNSDGGQ